VFFPEARAKAITPNRKRRNEGRQKQPLSGRVIPERPVLVKERGQRLVEEAEETDPRRGLHRGGSFESRVPTRQHKSS